MQDKDFAALVSVSIILATIAAVVFASMSYTPPHMGSAVEAHGFSDVEIGGWAPLQCGKDDSVCRSFTATNGKGERVNGAVGCGFFFKSCTVRF